MKCLYCNEEMVKGYMDQTQIGYPLKRYSGKSVPGILFDKLESIKLTSALKSGRVIVHRCAKRRKFIIDQDEIEI